MIDIFAGLTISVFMFAVIYFLKEIDNKIQKIDNSCAYPIIGFKKSESTYINISNSTYTFIEKDKENNTYFIFVSYGNSKKDKNNGIILKDCFKTKKEAENWFEELYLHYNK